MNSLAPRFRQRAALRRAAILLAQTVWAAPVLFGAGGVAQAADCYWKATSTASFNNAGNWTCGSIPGSGDKVHFDTGGGNGGKNSSCTLDSAVTVLELDIQAYSGTITLNANLTLNGNVTIVAEPNSLAGTGTVILKATSSSGTLQSGGATFPALTVNGSGGTYTLQDALSVTGALTLSNGTLTVGTNGVEVGSFSQGGGTFKASSGTTQIDGAFSRTAGTFTANGGTVTLSGAGVLRSGGASFSALAVAASGTYAQQDALTTTGSLSITGGTLAAGAYNVQVGGSFSMSGGAFTGGTGTVAVTGGVTLTGGTYTGGTGSATVAGSVSVTNSVTNGADPNLVGYWGLDETASPAVDTSGNGNSLTWAGTPTTTTAVPGAITFTDTRALAMTGTTESAATAALSGIPELRPATVTVSAWYKATSVDTNGSEIVSGSNTYGLRITTAGLTVMKRITDNSAQADWIEYRVPETGILDGNWHQIVGVIVTGTGGGMSAYFDGAIAAGSYWVNGSDGASQLSASSTPTASAAAAAAIDWDANTETLGFVVGNNPSTAGYNFGGSAGGGTACNTTTRICAIDDVRLYNRALSAAEIAALSHGNQPGSNAGVLSLSGSLTVSGGVTVQSTGTLTLASGSTLAVGTSTVAGSLTIDGTLNATGGTIKAVSAAKPYAFKVGSTAAAAPELNINGLAVKNTDANGMWINANAGAVTTFTEFDKLAFSSGTGAQLLKIRAATLYLSSNGCTFDGSTTVAIALTSSATGSAIGPRLLFGNATCATNDAVSGLCATSEKTDDDSDNNGTPSPTTGGVVQFIRAAATDMNGALVGFPTAAFDWNSFTYYSTYVAFHDASGGSDAIYVRDESGNPLYAWTDPTADETITGTPQWVSTTVSGVTTHYLYVSVNSGSVNGGKVYRLKDTGTGTTSGTLTVDSSWPASSPGAYSCNCTITSSLSLDANNVYWAATTASGQVLEGVKQSNGTVIRTGWPVTTPVNVTTSSPTLSTVSGTTTLYLGVTGDLLQLAVTGTTFVTNSKPATITGRVSFGTSSLAATNGTSRVYAGDSSGVMTAISPTNFTGTNSLWSYTVAGTGVAITDNYYDGTTDTVQFGTSTGKIVALTGAGALVNSSYPYPLTDPITAAPLYVNGVLAVGTTLGTLYFLDRNTGNATSPNGVSILRQYRFGPTESVSTIGYDANVSRYMISTSSAANDGRVYYFDAVTDPTPSFP